MTLDSPTPEHWQDDFSAAFNPERIKDLALKLNVPEGVLRRWIIEEIDRKKRLAVADAPRSRKSDPKKQHLVRTNPFHKFPHPDEELLVSAEWERERKLSTTKPRPGTKDRLIFDTLVKNKQNIIATCNELYAMEDFTPFGFENIRRRIYVVKQNHQSALDRAHIALHGSL